MEITTRTISRRKVVIPRYYKEDLSIAAWERELAYKEEENKFCNIAMQDEDIDPNEC